MSDSPVITGNENVIIQDVTENAITVSVNGEIQKIRNVLDELKSLMQKNQVQTFQTADKIYNIGSINEANFGAVIGKKAFNVLLTRKLIEAIKPYNNSAKKFLTATVSNSPDWETESRFSDLAKNIIGSGFVGVLGVQLRKLMAIGKEDLSESKERNYLENCILTSKRTLQLVCFAFISKLWDIKKDKSHPLSPDQVKTLQYFFEATFELNLTEYLQLYKMLTAFFKEHQLIYPFVEINDIEESLKEDSDFMKACVKLKDINDLLDRSQSTLSHCFEAEAELAAFLETFNFLAAYKMVSIKSIAYEEMRNSQPRYLHNYAELGIDSKSNMNAERVNYTETPINTDAILLYKGKYQDSVNLFPFIIDLNALTFEGGVKICFYISQDLNDGSLNYSALENNKVENIVFHDTLKKSGKDINELMMDDEKYKDLKLDTVHDFFQKAKMVILDLPVE